MASRTLRLGWLAAALMAASAHGQAFSSGSDGSDGVLEVTSSMVLPMPLDGRFDFESITVASGAVLSFSLNPAANNPPVHLLSQGPVVIAGVVDVSGGPALVNPSRAGIGGPGGFNGGEPGSIGVAPGDGHGPGGGAGGDNVGSGASSVGGGAYSTRPNRDNAGQTYGSSLLLPILGGSGGGGTTGSPGCGGGAGGGAILIASDVSIEIAGTGQVKADGSSGGCTFLHGGSGGAVRLVAPRVFGSGTLRAVGGLDGGSGRLRIDTLDRSGANLTTNPAAVFGSLMTVFLTPAPGLSIVEAAGTQIPAGSGPVQVLLPIGAPTMQEVTVRATNFTGLVPVRLVLTPDVGDRVVVDGVIDAGNGPEGEETFTVAFPSNTVTHVYAFTR